jgi:hypothetical protein
MTKRRAIFWTAICGLVFLISLLVFKRYLPYTGRALGPKTMPSIILTIEDSYLVGSHNGTKLWSMRAKLIELSNDRSTTHISGIKNAKLFVKGKPALTLSAGEAYYDINSRDLRLFGGLDIVAWNGSRIRGTGAEWNSAESILRSIGSVEFATRWSKAWTERLIVDVKRKEATMWNVRFKFDPRDPMRDEVGENAG